MRGSPFTDERCRFQLKRLTDAAGDTEAARDAIRGSTRLVRDLREHDRMVGCSFEQHVMDAGEQDAAVDEPTQRGRARSAGRRAGPATGDVLASEPTARADVYAISLFPSSAVVVVMTRYADAIEKVREMARDLGVDGWYTCDHTHYAQVAIQRRTAPEERANR